ncbi:MAG: hypothetical protein Q7R79_00020 [bacterium]|nr:hypothetical protein [bacterium]
MDKRKIQLITRLVHHYISSAQPVGSISLVEKYRMSVSSATVRNELVVLEQQGYIAQPHLSAGRIPTELGYRLYIKYMKPVRLTDTQEQQLRLVWKEHLDDLEMKLKRMAKMLAELTGEVVFIAFDKKHTYCTGVGNLCTKPEFDDKKLVSSISEVIDTLDEIIEKIYQDIPDRPEILIGQQNYFSKECSTIVMRYTTKDKQGVIGIMGPMRMNYGRNMSLMESARKLINVNY